jgi:membrane protease YdiL (CAAX protease family)
VNLLSDNTNNKDLDQTSNCYNCFKSIPSIAVFCPFCGIQIAESVQQDTGQPTYSSFESYKKYFIDANKKPEKPGLLKLPLFFIIFCIFGLELLLEFLVILFYILIIPTQEITNEVSLVLSNIIRILQVAVLFYFITRNRHMVNFRPFDNSKSSETSTLRYNNSVIYSIKTSVLTISLIISLVFLLNLVSVYVIDLIKSLFNINTAYNSPYSSFSETDALLIIFAISAIFFAPILEEVLFRGFLHYSFAKANLSDWSQYFLQAFLFAFLHLLPDIIGNASLDFIILHMISTSTLAIGATWLRKKYDSVTYSILLHMAWNSFSTILSFIPELVQSESDLIFFDNLLIGSFIIVSLLAIFFLKITKEWSFGTPQAIKSFKTDKDSILYKVVILTIFFAVFFNILQFLPIFLEDYDFNEMQIVIYILSVSIISGFLLFIWSRRLYDATIFEILKKNNREL